MFTTPCFIRKDSEELRGNLEELGYHKFDAGSDTLGDGDVLSVVELDTHEPIYSYVPYINIECIDDDIDCGVNEELFLAIAALRDDSDNYQYFVHNEDNSYWIECNHDEFHLCALDFENLTYIDYKDSFHKATVEELIEHFKSKEEE